MIEAISGAILHGTRTHSAGDLGLLCLLGVIGWACPLRPNPAEASKRRPKMHQAAQAPGPTSGGGRFELQCQPTTRSPTGARNCLRHKDFRGVLTARRCPRNNPQEPAKTRPEVKRFTGTTAPLRTSLTSEHVRSRSRPGNPRPRLVVDVTKPSLGASQETGPVVPGS